MIHQPLPDEWRKICVEMISPRPANNAGAQWREMQLFVSITKTEKQSRSDSQAVTALRKYDGGGERARGLVGAEVVKPTYTQFIQRFQLTLIIAVDESARFLHLSNFCGRSYVLLREWEWARSGAESFCGILFSYKVRRDGKTCSRANWRGRLRLDFMPPYNAQGKPESCWPFRVHPNRY